MNSLIYEYICTYYICIYLFVSRVPGSGCSEGNENEERGSTPRDAPQDPLWTADARPGTHLGPLEARLTFLRARPRPLEDPQTSQGSRQGSKVPARKLSRDSGRAHQSLQGAHKAVLELKTGSPGTSLVNSQATPGSSQAPRKIPIASAGTPQGPPRGFLGSTSDL